MCVDCDVRPWMDTEHEHVLAVCVCVFALVK